MGMMMKADIKAARFVDDINASADFMGPGALLTNRYQAEIVDLVRRRYALGQRIAQTPATGQPSRYFQQESIPTATFTDPRVIVPVASQPKRVERYLVIKGLVSQINFSFFDTEMNTQVGQFANLQAKDTNDMLTGILKKHDQALWTGSDTDLILPSTTEYYGISGQIVRATQVGEYSQIYSLGSTPWVAPNTGDSITDAVKTQVARMLTKKDWDVMPTAIYLNGIFNDKWEQEVKQQQQFFNEVEIMPGVIVKSVMTQAGPLPIIQDPAIDNLTTGSNKLYAAFILTENLIEYHYVTTPLPRVFQLGLLGNLAQQMVGIKFGAVVAKAPATAHSVVLTVRS